MKKIKLNFVQLTLLIFIPVIAMSIITGSLIYMRLNDTGTVTTTNNKHVNEFIRTYNKLIDEYYEDLNENELIDAAIGGMLDYTGDDYTIYLDESETEVLNEKLDGTYDGIGIKITLNEKNEVYVVDVFDNSPAKLAGIEVNDVLISINGELVLGKTLDEASNIIKKNKETNKFNVVVKRNGIEKSFEIERKTLIVPALESSIKEVNGKKIGYVHLETFSNTLDIQLESTLLSMENDGINSLIIDVRGNIGGYLTSCTNIIELFLEKDKLMYTIKSKKDNEDYKDTTDTKRDYPVVVLIDGASASASEILAGALKYSYGATIIGLTSYGKGKVQTTGTLEDGTMIKYTSARWFMPNGECIDEIGIKPDIEIKYSDKFIDEKIDENDDMLNEAIKLLTK